MDSHEAPRQRRSELRLLARSVARAGGDLARRRVHQPSDQVGRRLGFADGTSTRVYRETVVDHAAVEPVVLLVTFRLRWIQGEPWHALFRWESLANTVLFVGFPGFVSKLWCAHDERGAYRGLYQWDGADRAEAYVASLRLVLGLVSEPASIRHAVLAGVVRDELLDDPSLAGVSGTGAQDAWWRLVETDRPLVARS